MDFENNMGQMQMCSMKHFSIISCSPHIIQRINPHLQFLSPTKWKIQHDWQCKKHKKLIFFLWLQRTPAKTLPNGTKKQSWSVLGLPTHLDDLLLRVLFDDVFIHPNLAKFILNDGEFHTMVWGFQNVVQQCCLARTKKSCEHGHRHNFWHETVPRKHKRCELETSATPPARLEQTIKKKTSKKLWNGPHVSCNFSCNS